MLVRISVPATACVLVVRVPRQIRFSLTSKFNPLLGSFLYDVRTGWGMGSTKSRQRKTKSADSFFDKGEGGTMIQIFCGRHISIAPYLRMNN